MIFLSLGTQLPFDRLVSFVDKCAEIYKLEIIAQGVIGDVKPQYFDLIESFDESEYNEIFERSEIVISHAGMGTIISAHEYEKKLLILPRLSEFHEHRNNHQLATKERFKDRVGLHFFNDLEGLSQLIESKDNLSCCSQVQEGGQLISYIQTYLAELN